MMIRYRSLFNFIFFTVCLATLMACSDRNIRDEESTGETETSAENNAKSIIVVGAGIAGLNAASILNKEGFDVTVLESRDRIGGRLWTDKSINGIPLDLGASWIHGISGNPLYDLAQQNNVSTHVWNLDDVALYNTDGETNADLESRMDSLNTLIEDLASEDRFIDRSFDEVIQILKAEDELSAYSDEEINFIISAFYENEYAGSSSTLSTSSLNVGGVFPGNEVIFPNGYDQLTTILAHGVNVLTNQKVTEIDYRSAKSVVRTANNESFEADYVLVTVPLGVLKQGVIQFLPSLPSEKVNAINALGMGTLNKVYLKFATAFWGDEAQNIGYISDPKGQFTSWINLLPATKEPILMGFMSGDEAEKMDSLSDEEIIANAMTVLRNIYGDNIAEPEQNIITRWTNDPHTFGAYSYLTTEATNDMRSDLAEPVDAKLYFAGEASHEEHPSTVHGAFLSGERKQTELFNLVARITLTLEPVSP